MAICVVRLSKPISKQITFYVNKNAENGNVEVY